MGPKNSAIVNRGPPSKELSWFDRLNLKLESLIDVEPIAAPSPSLLVQHTSEYVESSVGAVGSSMRKLCGDIMRDLFLPPFPPEDQMDVVASLSEKPVESRQMPEVNEVQEAKKTAVVKVMDAQENETKEGTRAMGLEGLMESKAKLVAGSHDVKGMSMRERAVQPLVESLQTETLRRKRRGALNAVRVNTELPKERAAGVVQAGHVMRPLKKTLSRTGRSEGEMENGKPKLSVITGGEPVKKAIQIGDSEKGAKEACALEQQRVEGEGSRSKERVERRERSTKGAGQIEMTLHEEPTVVHSHVSSPPVTLNVTVTDDVAGEGNKVPCVNGASEEENMEPPLDISVTKGGKSVVRCVREFREDDTTVEEESMLVDWKPEAEAEAGGTVEEGARFLMEGAIEARKGEIRPSVCERRVDGKAEAMQSLDNAGVEDNTGEVEDDENIPEIGEDTCETNSELGSVGAPFHASQSSALSAREMGEMTMGSEGAEAQAWWYVSSESQRNWGLMTHSDSMLSVSSDGVLGGRAGETEWDWELL